MPISPKTICIKSYYTYPFLYMSRDVFKEDIHITPKR